LDERRLIFAAAAAGDASMKLCCFHLMPWTDLPADFAERYPSVWVDVDPTLFDPCRGHALYNEFLDELELAAELGFDAICVNEHHASAYGDRDQRSGLRRSVPGCVTSLD
jgi:hypothetical protein